MISNHVRLFNLTHLPTHLPDYPVRVNQNPDLLTGMEDQGKLLKEIFGDSSDGEEEGDDHGGSLATWEAIEEIKGLWLCRDFLSLEQQSTLLSAIQNEGWFIEDSNNQAMRFGSLPSWALELSDYIRQVVLFGDHNCEPMNVVDSYTCNGACLLPSNILSREPLFDQLIVNVYRPGEGICAHVDLLRFEDGIAIVSLESSSVMHFTQVGEACDNREGEKKEESLTRIPLYLTPGSLVLLSEDARYLWKHEINRKPGFQIWEGQELDQKRRTSITLRKLCCVE